MVIVAFYFRQVDGALVYDEASFINQALADVWVELMRAAYGDAFII